MGVRNKSSRKYRGGRDRGKNKEEAREETLIFLIHKCMIYAQRSAWSKDAHNQIEW